MTAERIITDLTARGIRLTRDRAGALRAGPAVAITPELAALIRDHRAELLAALAPLPDPLAVRDFYEERAAVFEFDGEPAARPRPKRQRCAARSSTSTCPTPAPVASMPPSPP